MGGALRTATGRVGTAGIARRRRPPTFKNVPSPGSMLRTDRGRQGPPCPTRGLEH